MDKLQKLETEYLTAFTKVVLEQNPTGEKPYTIVKPNELKQAYINECPEIPPIIIEKDAKRYANKVLKNGRKLTASIHEQLEMLHLMSFDTNITLLETVIKFLQHEEIPNEEFEELVQNIIMCLETEKAITTAGSMFLQIIGVPEKQAKLDRPIRMLQRKDIQQILTIAELRGDKENVRNLLDALFVFDYVNMEVNYLGEDLKGNKTPYQQAIEDNKNMIITDKFINEIAQTDLFNSYTKMVENDFEQVLEKIKEDYRNEVQGGEK